MKVYLVTEGDYSSYSICGVFSTLEKAQQYTKYFKNRSLFNSGYDIEEYTIDPVPNFVYKENKKMFQVRMQKDGTIDFAYETSPDRYEPPELRELGGDEFPTFIMFVWANDKNHAIKIVNEQRTLLLANDLWNQRKLEKLLEENEKSAKEAEKCLKKLGKITKKAEKSLKNLGNA